MSTPADRRYAYVERQRDRGLNSMTVFVPRTVHSELKNKAAQRGQSLQNYVAYVLTEHIRSQ